MIIKLRKFAKWVRVPNRDPDDVADCAAVEIMYRCKPVVQIQWTRSKASTDPESVVGPWRIDDLAFTGGSTFRITPKNLENAAGYVEATGRALIAAASIIQKFGPDNFNELPRTTKEMV